MAVDEADEKRAGNNLRILVGNVCVGDTTLGTLAGTVEERKGIQRWATDQTHLI